MYSFTVDRTWLAHTIDLKLIRADLSQTFTGASLGYRSVIYFQQKQVMTTKRRKVVGDSVGWDEAFEL
jgi:hypothetical protein